MALPGLRLKPRPNDSYETPPTQSCEIYCRKRSTKQRQHIFHGSESRFNCSIFFFFIYVILIIFIFSFSHFPLLFSIFPFFFPHRLPKVFITFLISSTRSVMPSMFQISPRLPICCPSCDPRRISEGPCRRLALLEYRVPVRRLKGP